MTELAFRKLGNWKPSPVPYSLLVLQNQIDAVYNLKLTNYHKNFVWKIRNNTFQRFKVIEKLQNWLKWHSRTWSVDWLSIKIKLMQFIIPNYNKLFKLTTGTLYGILERIDFKCLIQDQILLNDLNDVYRTWIVKRFRKRFISISKIKLMQ